jgi:MFS family permease
MVQRGGSSAWAAVALMTAASLPVLGATMVAVALPAMAVDLEASAAAVAWVVTTFFGVQLLVQPVAGTLADRLGHHRALRGGLAVLAAGTLAAMATPTFGGLLCARAVQALGVAVILPVVHAQLARVPSHTGRRFGLLTALANLSAGIGPALGTLLVGQLGWRGVFAALTVMTALGGVLVALAGRGGGLGDGRGDGPVRPADRHGGGAVALLADRRVLAASALGALDNVALTLLLVGLPLVLARSTTVSPAWAVTTVMATGAVAALIGGSLADRWGHLVVARGGFLGVAGGVLAVGICEPVLGSVGVLLGLAVAGAGLGVEFPAVQAAPLALVEARRRAAAAGIAASSRHLGSLVGALLVSGLLLSAPALVVPAAAVPALLGAGLASGARQAGRSPASHGRRCGSAASRYSSPRQLPSAA